MFVYAGACLCMFVYVCVRMCMYVYVCVCMWMYVYVCVYVCIYNNNDDDITGCSTFLPRSFRADSSSPRISAIRFGCFTMESESLRDSPQNFRKKWRGDTTEILAHVSCECCCEYL